MEEEDRKGYDEEDDKMGSFSIQRAPESQGRSNWNENSGGNRGVDEQDMHEMFNDKTRNGVGR